MRIFSTGAGDSAAALQLGRSAIDAYFVIAQFADDWSTGAGAGDLVIRTQTKNILFNTNGGSGAADAVITSAGNVGIGTTNPGKTLDVTGTMRTSGGLYLSSATVADHWAILPWGTNSNNLMFKETDSDTNYFVIDPNTYYGGSAGGLKVFQDFGVAGASGSLSDATLYVDSSVGRVGIGTTNPSTAKLLITDAGTAPVLDMQRITSTGGVTTTGVDGLQIDFTQGDDADATDTNSGLTINMTSSSGDADTLYGINIGNITGGAATETGLRIGTGWDKGIKVESGGIEVAGGSFTYSGSARPTKTISLQPEYAGGIITAFYGGGTDTSITGSMTSDTDTSGNLLRNYYQWSSSQASLNYYTVAVRVRLPKDFSAWATSNAIQVDYSTQSTVNTNNLVNIYIYNGDDTPGTAVTSSTGNVSGTASTWTTASIDDSAIDDGAAPDWDAADESAVIYIRMGSLSSNVVKIGEIRLNYLASF